jgi:hypothetical protein
VGTRIGLSKLINVGRETVVFLSLVVTWCPSLAALPSPFSFTSTPGFNRRLSTIYFGVILSSIAITSGTLRNSHRCVFSTLLEAQAAPTQVSINNSEQTFAFSTQRMKKRARVPGSTSLHKVGHKIPYGNILQ